LRWLKHMTATMNDERIAAYVAECGLEGYGFYWALLEVVAGNIEKDSTEATVTYPLTRWSRLLYSHHHRVGKYLGKLQGNGLVTFECIGSDVKVTVPKLLKYRDEYTKKSGHYLENVRPKIQRQNTDTDTEADNNSKPQKSAKPKTCFKSPAQASAFAEFWEAYWRKVARAAAEKAYARAITTTGLHAQVMAAIVAQTPEMLMRDPSVRPHAATWLNQRRWTDQIESEVIVMPRMKTDRERGLAG
jgi:hypothetical protein